MTATQEAAVAQAISVLRPGVAALHEELRRNGLVAWTAGNVSGACVAQISIAYGQRVLKRQPLGRFRGLGMSPERTMRRRAR